jgi:hypothetical protein
MATSTAYAKIPVRVTLSTGTGTVASTVVHGRAHYSFKVSPGIYQVSIGKALPAVHVTVRPGTHEHASIIPNCK